MPLHRILSAPVLRRAPARLGLYVLAGLALCCASLARAEVMIFASDTGAEYTQAGEAFTRTLARSTDAPRITNALATRAGDDARLRATSPSDLIVAIGSAATEQALAAQPRAPVLGILLPRAQFERLRELHARNGSTRFSAIYMDQPLLRQLRLCRLVAPQARRIGALLGPVSRQRADELRGAAEGLQIATTLIDADPGDNLVAKLNQVLPDSDLIIALPDPDIFNRYTVAGLLLTAYHHNVAVIGFSAAYVNAGALAAVYSTPEQIGRDAAETALSARSPAGWTLPAPRSPLLYSVTVNRQVARSLEMQLPDDNELLHALLQQEIE